MVLECCQSTHPFSIEEIEQHGARTAFERYDGCSHNYEELAAHSRRICTLFDEASVPPGSLIVAGPLDEYTRIATMLAAFEYGATYLPTDDPEAAHNETRGSVESIWSVRSDHSIADRTPELLSLESDIGAIERNRATGAYAIRTSGTTGTPKTVVVTACSLKEHVEAISSLYEMRSSDRSLTTNSMILDAWIEQVAVALSNGASILGSRPGPTTENELIDAVLRRKATILDVATALWRSLDRARIASEWHAVAPRMVLLGGEALGSSDLDACSLEQTKFLNVYGPSEAVVTASSYHITRDRLTDGPCPIGTKGIGDRDLHVLNSELNPVDYGQPGILYISGSPLSAGYLGVPEPATDQFVEINDGAGGRAFKTNDVVVRRPDGSIVFESRSDEMLKVSGHRTSPRAVEQNVLRHAQVQSTAATIYSAGDSPRIGALVVLSDSERNPDQVAAQLAQSGPAHLRPALVITADSLPVTLHGKTDYVTLRSMLEDSLASRLANRSDTDSEPELAAILDAISSVFGWTCGPDDDFVAMGATSLMITECWLRLEDLGYSAPIEAVFESRTPRRLLTVLKSLPKHKVDQLQQEGAETSRLSEQQLTVWLESKLGRSRAYAFHDRLDVNGDLGTDDLRTALRAIALRHSIMRTTFHEHRGRPHCEVHHEPIIDLEYQDLRFVKNQDQSISEIESHIVKQHFVESELPLVRWHLIRLSDTSAYLYHSEHHLIHDAWSLRLFVDELRRELAEPGISPTSHHKLGYGSYTSWQRSWLESSDYEASRRYWSSELAGAPTVSSAATSTATSPEGRGCQLLQDIPAGVAQRIRDTAKVSGVSVYALCLGRFAQVLAQQAGQAEVVVGVSTANRSVRGSREILGMLVNMLPVRIDTAVHQRHFAQHVQRKLRQALAAETVPFRVIAKDWLAKHHNLQSRSSPLFRWSFSFDEDFSPDSSRQQVSDADHEAVTIDFDEGVMHNGSAKFETNVVMIPRRPDGGMRVLWEHDASLISHREAERLLSAFVQSITEL